MGYYPYSLLLFPPFFFCHLSEGGNLGKNHCIIYLHTAHPSIKLEFCLWYCDFMPKKEREVFIIIS